MGLDNYPDPPPCLVMEKAGRLKIARTPDGRIDCEKTQCPFKSIPHIMGGVFGTYCWLRGKVYDDLVEELTGFSLYEDLSRRDLEAVLQRLLEPEGNIGTIALLDDDERRVDLIRYLKALLSSGWDGKLVAWY